MRRLASTTLVVAVLLAGCGGSGDDNDADASESDRSEEYRDYLEDEYPNATKAQVDEVIAASEDTCELKGDAFQLAIAQMIDADTEYRPGVEYLCPDRLDEVREAEDPRAGLSPEEQERYDDVLEEMSEDD